MIALRIIMSLILKTRLYLFDKHTRSVQTEKDQTEKLFYFNAPLLFYL